MVGILRNCSSDLVVEELRFSRGGLPDEPVVGIGGAHAGDFQLGIDGFELCEKPQGAEGCGGIRRLAGRVLEFEVGIRMGRWADWGDLHVEFVAEIFSEMGFQRGESWEFPDEVIVGLECFEVSGEFDFDGDFFHAREFLAVAGG